MGEQFMYFRPIFGIALVACLLWASAPAQAAKTKRVTRNYPVAQILEYVSLTKEPVTEPGPDKTDKAAKPTEEKLIDLIVSTVEPASWKQNGGHGKISYEPVSKSLVIHQSIDAHEQVTDLLAALERLMDLQVVLEIRLLTISEACFERMGIDFEPVGDSKECEKTRQLSKVVSETVTTSDGLKTVVPRGCTEVMPAPIQIGKAFLTDSQVRKLLEAAQGDRHTRIMQAPKLTMLNGQSGTIKVCETKVFLTDLDFDFTGDKVTCIPKQQASDFGTCFTVMPTVSADRKSVLVKLTFKETELVGPVPVIPVQIPTKRGKSGKEKTSSEAVTMFLQQPQVTTLAIDNTTVIPEGQTLLLGSVKLLTEGRNELGPPILSKIPYLNRVFKSVGYGRETVSLVILVTPRIVVQEEDHHQP
jgi:type II secretory pathway component GspD/PulD (secretin)